MSDSENIFQQYGNIISAVAFITAVVIGIIKGIEISEVEKSPRTSTPTNEVTVKPIPPPSQPPANKTNATVAGEPGIKNIRDGPGTIHSIVGRVSTGSRVRILSQAQDRGGYLWYKIYHPSSDTQGWMAAQLISVD